MYQRDYRDLIGGALLIVAGLLIAWHAYTTLDFGTVRRMGPGMFPTSIGLVLAGFGIAIMVPAFFRPGTMEAVEWRSAGAVLASVAVFAMTIRPFGLVPAIVALIFVASLAEQKFRPISLTIMSVILSVCAWGIFSKGLGLPLVMWRSPF